MNPSSSIHLHRFAVSCPLSFPCDASCQSTSVDEEEDRLQISLHALSEIPVSLASVQKRELYDFGDSALIWMKGFGMQIDIPGRHLKIYLSEIEKWPRIAKTVLNVGLSAAAHLRGDLPLHAGAVSLDGRFVGVIAPSGTGKSTLIWSLIQHGALFGNDDLVNVRMDGEIPIAMPSVSLYPKLCSPSYIERADETSAIETYSGSGEFWMHIHPTQRLTEPQPLHCLFSLEPDENCEQINVRRWGEGNANLLLPNDLEAAFLLKSHLHGAQFGRMFGQADALQARIMKLAEKTPVFALRYPKRFDQIPRLIETMRSLVNEQSAPLI